MTPTESLLACVSTIVMAALLLLIVAPVPWCTAAGLFRSSIVTERQKRILSAITTTSSVVVSCVLCTNPPILGAAFPPAGDFVQYMLSDSSLDAMGSSSKAIIQTVLICECVLAIFFPTLLSSLVLLIGLYRSVVAAPVHLTRSLTNRFIKVASAPYHFAQKRAAVRRVRRAEQERMRVQQLEQRRQQQQEEQERCAHEEEKRKAARRQAARARREAARQALEEEQREREERDRNRLRQSELGENYTDAKRRIELEYQQLLDEECERARDSGFSEDVIRDSIKNLVRRYRNEQVEKAIELLREYMDMPLFADGKPSVDRQIIEIKQALAAADIRDEVTRQLNDENPAS